uniref:Uncharacterized protein n=1 Tax=Photinus pyralis TaxID=7054 RepID=A0A1Y1KJY4_PHOPY
MLKFTHGVKLFRSLRKSLRFSSSILNNSNLHIANIARNNYGKYGKGQEWTIPGLNLYSLILPFSIGIAHCDSNYEDKQFFRVVRYGIAVEVQKLLEMYSIDVNKRHYLGWTPLMVAVVNQKFDVCKLLVAAGADLNLTDEYTNPHRTAHEKGIHTLEVLMVRDEEFCMMLNNRETYLGCTALHYAVLVDNLEIVKFLIANGANPCIENDAGHKPLRYARANSEVEQFLKDTTSKYEERQKEKELEERRRFPIEERLKQFIVGQEGAITTVAACKCPCYKSNCKLSVKVYGGRRMGGSTRIIH